MKTYKNNFFSFFCSYGEKIESQLRIQSGGGSRIFSRGGGGGGGGFSKKLFRSTKLIFRALPKHCFAPILAKFSAPHANFLKTVKKAVFGHFLKNFAFFSRFFFGARSPSKLVYVGAKGAFRKILGSVGQKWISEKVSKGGPFGSAGGRIPEGGGNKFPKQILLAKSLVFFGAPSLSNLIKNILAPKAPLKIF